MQREGWMYDLLEKARSNFAMWLQLFNILGFCMVTILLALKSGADDFCHKTTSSSHLFMSLSSLSQCHQCHQYNLIRCWQVSDHIKLAYYSESSSSHLFTSLSPRSQSWKVSWLVFTSIRLGTSHLDQQVNPPKTNEGWQETKKQCRVTNKQMRFRKGKWWSVQKISGEPENVRWQTNKWDRSLV